MAVVGLVVITCLGFWYKSVLQGLAGPLVADPPQPDWNCLVVIDGDGCYDRAAAGYHENTARRILLIERYRDRCVQIGALRSFDERSRSELKDRGAPDEAVTTIRGQSRTRWDEAHLLGKWLEEHPDARPLILCDRFWSGYTRHILDSSLGPAEAARVEVLGLPDRRYDETNWWKSRCGMKSFVISYLALAYAWYQGEDQVVVEPWDLDEYERVVRQIAGEDSG